MKLAKISKYTHHIRSTANLKKLSYSSLWFILGGILGLFFFLSFSLFYYENKYKDVAYPGITIGNIGVGGKTKQEIIVFFDQKNKVIQDAPIEFSANNTISTSSAKELQIGYNSDLLADQAYSIGRSKNKLSNIVLLTQTYTHGLNLPLSYRYSEEEFQKVIVPFEKTINKDPVNALFTFADNRVNTFRPSVPGQKVSTEKLIKKFNDTVEKLALGQQKKLITITIPVETIQPDVTTEKVNNLGIRELVGRGTSLFFGSIPNRIDNIKLAASRINGALIKPGETFSFNKALGDVSSLAGYKQAYIIQNGRTVLGDGGGVCQVSTTFFRALLEAGVPILERNQHAYRVHYYEEDQPPGIDAAIYTPNIDLKFKNDTGHYILVQTIFSPEEYRLTFELYGTKDGREVTINKPVILSTSPPPEPLYQDDPTLPKGQIKQVDWAAPGAKVYFTREVKKEGKVILSDKFNSNFRPWQAVYLRGTKE